MTGNEFRPEVDHLRSEAEARYLEMGFSPIHVLDEPGKVYDAHSHHEVYLFGLGGSSRVRVGEGFVNLTRGTELHIGNNVQHEATVGSEGAEYLFAHPQDIDPFSYEP